MKFSRRSWAGILLVAVLPALALAILYQRSSRLPEIEPPSARPPDSDSSTPASSVTLPPTAAPSRLPSLPAAAPSKRPSHPVASVRTIQPSSHRPPRVQAATRPPWPLLPGDAAADLPPDLPVDPPPAIPIAAAGHRKLRGAVLAAHVSPLETLLENRLLADARVDWVERAEIDRVLKEQSLQAMFAPEAATSRARVGRLLGADVLVITREVERERGRFLELVVCETTQGLRFCSQVLPLAGSNDTTLESAADVVARALDKGREEIAEIWAMPPFVSDNLTNKHDALKGVYARLIEQVLLRQPGILVVELAEARSVAAEAELTKGASPIARRLPLYVLGRFRQETKDGAEKVVIQLTLAQGSRTIRELPPRDCRVDEAGSYLCSAATAIYQESRGIPAEQPRPEIEARQLADRAATFARLGQWHDSLALNEASLLLRPRDVATLWQALVASQEVLHLTWAEMQKDWANPQRAFPFFDCHKRVWRYAVELVRRDPQLDRKYAELFFGLGFTEVAATAPYNIPVPATTLEMFSEAGQIRCDALVEITRLAVARSADCLKPPLDASGAMSMLEIVGRLMAKPAGSSWSTRLRAIEAVADSPEVVRHARCLTARASFELGVTTTIAKFAASGKPQLREVAEMLRKQFAFDRMNDAQIAERDELYRKKQSDFEANSRRLRNAKPTLMLRPGNLVSPNGSLAKPLQVPPPQVVDPPHPPNLPAEFTSRGVLFRPIWFHGVSFGRVQVMQGIDEIVPAGPGVDVIRCRESLYLMTEKGRLDFLGHCTTADTHRLMEIPDLRFDGRFLWISTAVGNNNPCLVVFEPQTRLAWTITKADGLPFLEASEHAVQGNDWRYAMAAPLGPGRVCVVAGFGRTWIGILHFDPGSGVKIEVVHEARTVGQRSGIGVIQQPWNDTSLAFVPLWTVPLNPPTARRNAERPHVLVFRPGIESYVAHPLDLDLEQRRCRALQSALPCPGFSMLRFGSSAGYGAFPAHWGREVLSNYSEADGVLYAVDPARGLLRFRPSDFQAEDVVPGLMPGSLLCQNGRFHIAGSKWWLGSLSPPRLLLEAETPWIARPDTKSPPSSPKPFLNRVCPSQHYGFVALCGGTEHSNSVFYQVVVPDTPGTP